MNEMQFLLDLKHVCTQEGGELFILTPLNVSFRNKPAHTVNRFGSEHVREDLLSRPSFRFVWVAGEGMQTLDRVMDE